METIIHYMDSLYNRYTTEERFNKEAERIACPIELYTPHSDLIILWVHIQDRRYSIHIYKDTKNIVLHMFNDGDESTLKSWLVSYIESKGGYVMREVFEHLKYHYTHTKFCITCNKYKYLSHWLPLVPGVGGEKCASEILHEYVLENDPCPICLTGSADYVTRCNHKFHRKCLVSTLKARKNEEEEDEEGPCYIPCPICRQSVHLHVAT